MIKKIFAPGNNPATVNLALFVLRVWVGLQMLLLHGLDKLKHFDQKSSGFIDPFHIGHGTSLALSVFAEVVVSVLVILGLFTRGSALVLGINMTVAFVVFHKGVLTGDKNGELALMFLLAYIVLFLAGPGSFSADQALFGKGDKPAKSSSNPPKKK